MRELEEVETATQGVHAGRIKVLPEHVHQWVARIREREHRPLALDALAGEVALVGMGQQRLIGSEEEHSRVLADRQGRDELRERVEVELDAEHAAQPPVAAVVAGITHEMPATPSVKNMYGAVHESFPRSLASL